MVKVQVNSQGKVYKSNDKVLLAKEFGTKSITSNGTYTASSDNLDGYSSVTVNVSGGSSGGGTTVTAYNNSMANVSNGDKVLINHETTDNHDYVIVDSKYYDYFTNHSATVNSKTGIVSGFTSSSAYIKLPEVFEPLNYSWEMVIKATTPASIAEVNGLLGTENSAYIRAVGIEIRMSSAGRFQVKLSSNESTWDMGTLVSVTTASGSTTYWIKVVYDKSAYSLYLSTDGVTYNLEATITSSQPIHDTALYYLAIGQVLTTSTRYPWKGTVDLSGCYIKVDDKYWWLPYTIPHNISSDNMFTGYAQENINTYSSGNVKILLS